MHTSSRWTYGLIALLLLLAIGLAFAAPIDPGSHKADPTAKYISRAVEDRDNPLYAGPGEPTAQALQAREQPSLLGPLPKRNGKSMMPALVRINDQVAVAKMRAKGCSIGAVIRDIATARIPVDQLAAVTNMPEVSYLKYAPKRDLLLDLSVPEVGGDVLHDMGFGGQGVIVGIVDTGIDWRHPDFINPDGTSRILYLWDQSDDVGPAPLPPFDYGTLWTNAEINAALQGMGTVREVDSYGHGTHVAGIAAGNGLAPGGFVGMAPQADLIIVKVDFESETGATDDALIDGNAFIADMAYELDRPVVINNSWGGHFGEPHDGSGLWETAMSDLTWEGVVIVAAAGNEGDLPMHAGTSISRGRDYQWHMWVLTGFFASEMAIDIWYPLETELEVSVAYDFPAEPSPVPPPPQLIMPVLCSTEQTEGVVTGDFDIFTIPDESSWAGAEVTIDATNAFNPSFEINHTQVFVDMSGGAGFGPLGIVLTLITGEPEFDAWVAGAIFLDFPFQMLTTCMTDPLPGFFIAGDNLKTVSPPSTGDEIISVASYNTKCSYLDFNEEEQDWCSIYPVGSASVFTSRGPRRDDVRKPDIAAPGAMIASALSQDTSESDAFITPDGQHVLLQGTSMACPHVVGAIALMMEKNPYLAPDDVKHYMLLTGRPGNLLGSGWDPVWGWGMLDAPAAVALVPEGYEPEPEVSVDFTAPIATIDLKYGTAEINWPAEFSGVAFDQDVIQPVPIPLDNLAILQHHWALNDQIIRVIIRPEDVRVDPDGTYNFFRVDPLIKAVADAGAKPMICTPDFPLTWTNWQFATWLAMVAVHFGAEYDLTGWYWEILDQADLQEWEPLRPRWDAWEYALMFNQVYDSLKQVAPQSKVGGPGLSEYDDLYVETLLRAVRVIDFISVHAEGATTVPRGNSPGVLNTALHFLGRNVDRAAALIARWKPDVEIVISAYGINAWRPVTDEVYDDTIYRMVDADPRVTEAAGAVWSVGALCQLMLSPQGHCAAVAVFQEATDGLDDMYSTPASMIEYDPFFGRGLWFADDPAFLAPAFFAQQLFGYYFPTGSEIVQAYSSDPFVMVLATTNGDPAVNVALINVSPRDAIAQLALTGLPYFEGTWYRVDEWTFPPGFLTEQVALGSVQTVQLAPYGVRILNIRNPFNVLRTPGLDVGGSVAGDKSVARDWVNQDELRHPEIYVMSTLTKHSGYACQAIVGGDDGGGKIAQITPIDSAEPGNRYEVSAYVQPRNVVSAAEVGAFVRVEFLDQFEQPLDPPAVYESDHLAGTATSFEKLQVLDENGDPGVIAPGAANRMRVELVLEADGGTAFFDRVYAGLADVGPEPPPGGGTIVGTVVAQDFVPIAGAKVSLQGRPYFTHTRSDGTYQIDFVPAGTYTVVAAKDGYETSIQAGQSVSDGEPTQVDFVLRPVGGLLRITSITAGETEVEPGQTDIEVTMLVDCLANKDVRVSHAGLRFAIMAEGFQDVTGDYTVVPDAANPTILWANTTSNAFTFLVSVNEGAQTGGVSIDGLVSGYLNLLPNGSFEAGTEVPPPGWYDEYIHAEIDQETAYEGTNSYHPWFWKDEPVEDEEYSWLLLPPWNWVATLNPVSVQGNATYRVGLAYKDREVQGKTDLYYRVYEFDEVGDPTKSGGWTLDHSPEWLAREGLYRVLPETRFVMVEIGMLARTSDLPFPVPDVFTADLWVDDVFVEPDSPITDNAADTVGSWTVVGEMGSLTLSAGWNMISLPADPVDPDPVVVFGGIPIDCALYRYDPGVQGYVGYRSDAPAEFGACRASEGYWLYLCEPASIRYATAGTRSQQITVSRPGWALVGLPQAEPALVATCLVDTGAGTLMMPQAAAAGWLDLPMYFYATDVQTYGSCALDAWWDDDTLRPWVGYWLYANPPVGQLIVVP